MDATTADIKDEGRLSSVNLWIPVLTVWHGLLCLVGLGAIFYLWSGAGSELNQWLRLALSVGIALMVAGSAAAAYFTSRRDRRGRLLSLGANYLLLIATLILLLTSWGVFIGLDSLADTFINGLPFLVIILIGWYIGSSMAGRFEESSAQRWIRLAGRVIIFIGLAGFLYAIGIFSGITALAQTYTEMRPIVLTILLALIGIMFWAMWRQPMAQALGSTIADGEVISGYLFLSPNLIGFLLFFAGPLLLSLYFSFTNWDAFGTRDWIGLENYASLFNLTFAALASPGQLGREVMDVTVYDELARISLLGRSYLIGAQDKLFWISLKNTIQYVILVVPLAVIPALFLANLLNSKLRGMKFFRSAYFVPSIAAVVGIALVWQWLYNSQIGFINYFITSTVNFLNNFGPEAHRPADSLAFRQSIRLNFSDHHGRWQMIGFNTVLFLAGLQQIPGELYEAVTVDGASSWRKFWNLTLPLLAPTTFFVLTTTVIRAMQVFEEIFILIPTNPAGPNNSTLSIVLYLYQKGFQRFEQGYASAIAWVLFLLIFGATLFQFQTTAPGWLWLRRIKEKEMKSYRLLTTFKNYRHLPCADRLCLSSCSSPSYLCWPRPSNHRRTPFSFPPRILPREPITIQPQEIGLEGEEPLPLYKIEVDGQMREMALVESSIRVGIFALPDNTEQTVERRPTEVEPVGGFVNQEMVMIDGEEYPLYEVDVDGEIVQMAQIGQTAFGRFVDVQNPEIEVLRNARLSEPVERSDLASGEFQRSHRTAKYGPQPLQHRASYPGCGVGHPNYIRARRLCLCAYAFSRPRCPVCAVFGHNHDPFCRPGDAHVPVDGQYRLGGSHGGLNRTLDLQRLRHFPHATVFYHDPPRDRGGGPD